MKEKSRSLAGERLDEVVSVVTDQDNIEHANALGKPANDSRPTLSVVASSSWGGFEASVYVKALHDDAEGIVHFLSLDPDTGTPNNRHIRSENVARTARAFAGKPDAYVSLGVYRHSGGPLAGIRTLHADLDYYNTAAWRDADPASALAAMNEALSAAGVPLPGLAVATGRGLQVVWLLSPVMLQAKPRAVAAMKGLVRLLKAFGADPACTNLTQVFRLPGSVNSKNGRPARLLACDPHRHDFDALCLAILGQRKPARKPARLRTPREKVAENRSLSHRRLADLQRLILGRWNGKTPEGCRNLVATIAVAHLVQLGGDPVENALDWCAKWTDGHAPAEIRRSVKTALRRRSGKGGGYRYKGLTIGQLLDITPDEVQRCQLTSIYAATDTQVDIDQRRRERKAAIERQKRRAAGATPHAESARRLKPWEALGISRATYYRQAPFVRQRKQNIRETISCPLHSVSSEAGYPGEARVVTEAEDIEAPAKMSLAGMAHTNMPGSTEPDSVPIQRPDLGSAATASRPVQLTFIGVLDHSVGDGSTPELAALADIQGYRGGIMPEHVARFLRDWRRKRGIKQAAAARALGISRPQLANAEHQRFGLGAGPASRLWDVVTGTIPLAA